MTKLEPMYMVVSRETDSIGIGTAYCIYPTRAEAARWQLAHGLRATTTIIQCF
jgi:hypothetical protein